MKNHWLHRWCRWRAPLLASLCALLACLCATPALAAVSCTATMTDVNFGSVNLVDTPNPTATATLNYACDNPGVLALPTNVKICFNVGDGVEGAGNLAPRIMKSGTTNTLQFQLYQSNGTTIWGSNGNATAPTPFTASFTVPGTVLGIGGRSTGSATMQGKIMAGQQGAVAGDYQDQFTGIHTSISLTTSLLVAPADCNGASSATFPFTARATVTANCAVTAADLDFGTADGLPGSINIDRQSTISVTCSNKTNYTVALTPSNNAATGAGVMAGAPSNTDRVPYRLYKDAARSTNVWGNSVGTNTATGTGNGTPQPLTVYGRVPSANFRPDSYRDTVTVTVAY
jgi:spore coat protein U-like protein